MSAILIKLDYLSAFRTIVSNFFPIIHVKSYPASLLLCQRAHPTPVNDRGKVCPLLYMCFLFSRIRVVVSMDPSTSSSTLPKNQDILKGCRVNCFATKEIGIISSATLLGGSKSSLLPSEGEELLWLIPVSLFDGRFFTDVPGVITINSSLQLFLKSDKD
jgi:hypothetical protein